MLSFEEVNQLGQILDTTWGKSSTNRGLPASMSFKASLMGDDKIKIVYTTIGTFASDRAMSQQISALENESIQATDAFVAEVKKQFKDVSGKTLKTKTESSTPSTEIISLQPHISPKRTAYYRRTTILSIA